MVEEAGFVAISRVVGQLGNVVGMPQATRNEQNTFQVQES
jgi:hypothetical protein